MSHNPFVAKDQDVQSIVQELNKTWQRENIILIRGKSIIELSPNTLKLLLHIMCSIGRGSDEVQLIVSYIATTTGLSRPTINKSINELITLDYIKHRGSRMYWININKILSY